METTITIDKNNFICGGQHARRFRSAAKFRGEKEDNVSVGLKFRNRMLLSLHSCRDYAEICRNHAPCVQTKIMISFKPFTGKNRTITLV